MTPNKGAHKSAKGNAHAHRRIQRTAGGQHHAAQCLDDGVHSFARTFAVAAKAGDGTIHDGGVGLPWPSCTYAGAVESAAAEVFNHHIGPFHQISEAAAAPRETSDSK